MLPKEHRLRRETDIKTLFSKGKSVFGHLVGLKLRPNGLESSRFAVVVGTKVSKKAVERNRLRRRIRAAVEARIGDLKGGHDVALLARPEALGKGFEEIDDAVERALRKARLL